MLSSHFFSSSSLSLFGSLAGSSLSTAVTPFSRPLAAYLLSLAGQPKSASRTFQEKNPESKALLNNQTFSCLCRNHLQLVIKLLVVIPSDPDANYYIHRFTPFVYSGKPRHIRLCGTFFEILYTTISLLQETCIQNAKKTGSNHRSY